MNMIGLVIAAAVMIAAGLLHDALTDMFKQEFGTRLAGLPKQLIHIAAKRLPVRIRTEYLEEWLSELDYVLRETEGLPLTRLIRGTHYAAGVLLAAWAIRRDGVKEREPLVTGAIEPQSEGGFQKLFIGNLPYVTTDEDLREFFAQYGEVFSAATVFDRATGRSKGFGFVEMPVQSADMLIWQADGEDGVNFGDRLLTISEARPKAEAR